MIFYLIKNLREFRNPFLRFTFLIVFFTLLTITFSCYKYQRSIESLEYINSPKTGDIYFINQENENILRLKIKEIGADSIAFNKYGLAIDHANYVDATPSSIKLEIVQYTNYDKFWTDSILVLSKEKLKSLYEKELIFEIKRN